MLNVINSRLLPTVLTVLLILLGGCAQWKAARPCPPVAPFPKGLADEVERLPADGPLYKALADYFVLHEQCK